MRSLGSERLVGASADGGRRDGGGNIDVGRSWCWRLGRGSIVEEPTKRFGLFGEDAEGGSAVDGGIFCESRMGARGAVDAGDAEVVEPELGEGEAHVVALERIGRFLDLSGVDEDVSKPWAWASRAMFRRWWCACSES
jgi:hypothetical protein